MIWWVLSITCSIILVISVVKVIHLTAELDRARDEYAAALAREKPTQP